MNVTERLRAGSVAKMFTAAVVLQLVAERRLLLGDSVERFVPGLIDTPDHDGRQRDLLRHTSGLPDYLDAPEWEHFEPRELVARALALPAPSGDWHYATTSYQVLGMRDTYWPGDEPRLQGPHSRSYFASEDGALTDGTDWNMTFGGVGGALVSSRRDLTQFATALFSGRL